MRKLLYVNGCSHSCGAEISYVNSTREPNDLEQSWGGILSRRHNLIHHNDATSGQSNYSIYSTTVHSILNLLETYHSSEIFVIIGWSSFERTELIYNNQLFRFVPGIADLPFYKDWPYVVRQSFRSYIQSVDYTNASPNSFSLICFSLINFLKNLNIDYYFFNAIQNLHYPTQNVLHSQLECQPTTKLFKLIENNQNYLEPYNHSMTYYNYLKTRYDCFQEGRNHHFREDAHQEWANILDQKITPLL